MPRSRARPVGCETIGGVSVISVPSQRLHRVAVLSVHTSPLDQPGQGDSGGLNVYVVELSRRLAEAGVQVEIFTRSTSPYEPDTVQLAPGVLVRSLRAGPEVPIDKADLPAHLCALTTALLRAESGHGDRYFDLIHSHYWLSGQVGAVASDRWNVPLIHSMHTMALVKNAQLAAGDVPEPQLRIVGEEQVVASADRLIANTVDEADDLIDLYGADPDRVDVVHPGVDLATFHPGDQAADRDLLGIDHSTRLLLFVGRIQPLKAPDVFIRSVAELVALRSGGNDRRPVRAVLCGGPSGPDGDRIADLRQLAKDLGVADVVRFEPPTSRERLAAWYRAADLVCVPSHSESFGLVAVEAQACGTAVVAADVGGLRTCLDDGETGVLIPSHDPSRWAMELDRLLTDDQLRAEMGRAAAVRAQSFSWSATAGATLRIYRDAVRARAVRDAQGDHASSA